MNQRILSIYFQTQNKIRKETERQNDAETDRWMGGQTGADTDTRTDSSVPDTPPPPLSLVFWPS